MCRRRLGLLFVLRGGSALYAPQRVIVSRAAGSRWASLAAATTTEASSLEGETTPRTKNEEWTVPRVRAAFIEYFVSKQHDVVESSPVVPVNDPTLLFANAGMNQFKPIFLGVAAPDSPLSKLSRACNAQKCIRAGGKHNDLEDVGFDTYHHTFFEMLGSWSFGDYFKEEAIAMAWELLTEVYGLDPDRLYATYFGGDEAEDLEADLEAKALWLRFLPEERVLPGSKKDNFWEMGESGPCGPCSEVHYDARGGRGNVAELVNADDPEVLEIWNIVFMQFDRAESGRLAPLPSKHVDTGMGLERLSAILQNKLSNYDTDAFSELFEAIRVEAGCEAYGGRVGSDATRDTAYRAVADHARCLGVALADGARPSNDGRGYVLRRVLRRAVRYGREVLGARDGFLSRLMPALAASHLGDAYPELRSRLDDVVSVVADEEASFAKTLERGVKYLDDELAALVSGGGGGGGGGMKLSGAAAFFLYDSLGFPLDLTTLMAAERGFEVDAAGFEREMRDQIARSRAAREAKRIESLGAARIVLGAADTAALAADGVPATESLVHDATTTTTTESVVAARVVAVFQLDAENMPARCEESTGVVGIVLDRSPFYAEGGGQVADEGVLELAEEGAVAVVKDVQAYAGYVLHTCLLVDEPVRVGDLVSARVDAERRSKIAPNHSMTHALNHALRAVLGDGVDQRGSLCDDEKLRFDFSHPKGLDPTQLTQVEDRVNALIQAAKPVQTSLVPLEDARQISSLRAVFGEDYPDPVRVVAAGADATIDEILETPRDDKWLELSIELCGGTHVSDTSDAEAFVIVEETAVAKGIRRIEAVTKARAATAQREGRELQAALDDLEARENPDAEGAKLFRAKVDSSLCSAALKPLLRARLELLTKKIAAAQKKERARLVADAEARLAEAVEAAARTGTDDDDRVVLDLGPGVDAKAAAAMATKLHADYPSLALLAFSAARDKTLVFAACPPDHPLAGAAPVWLEAVLEPLGGRGGGKPSFAQGTAPRADDDLDAAIRAARAFEPPAADSD
ncbi:hypothetical protein CTAYLR_005340 [Chrysophaeum taylorii]|uniref:Alanine--tRNA ligase n=1 Tax=Chrysophaeum taylorii TaxID=2483200 RepID=A0AAD7U6V3_9STRA|nr:hypothetical protein CTAYLR_005340 [Chrysophaeum taylorii]